MGKKKNAFRPRAQGIHHQFAVITLGQQHGSHLRIRNAQPAQQAEIRQAVPGNQNHVGVIRLHEVVESRREQSDRGYLKVPPAFQSPRQELRLNGTRIGDQDLHCFGFDRRGSCGWLSGAHGFHVTIMPKSAWTVCSPRHTALVMNSEVHVYFRRATLVHKFRSGALPAQRATATVTQPWRPKLPVSSPFR